MGWRPWRPRRHFHQTANLVFAHDGLSHNPLTDAYHFLLRARWRVTFAVLFSAFLTINTLFAGLYLAGGDCIAAPHPGSFLEAFAFSVQTLSGIGYGAMSPQTPYANLVSIGEAFVGLVYIAVCTGLMFAKFSRPTARVSFSKHALILPFNGQPTLQIRMANGRISQVVEAHVNILVLIDEVTKEGQELRSLVTLPLRRDHSPLFVLSWTVFHVIDEDSPLFGLTERNLEDRIQGIVVTFSGTDDTFAQTVHTQYRYSPEDIRWNMRFADIIETDDEGRLIVNHAKLHALEPLNRR